MSAIRQPAVAGMFYPADPALLQATVDQLLSDAAALVAPACTTSTPATSTTRKAAPPSAQVVTPPRSFVIGTPSSVTPSTQQAAAHIARQRLPGASEKRSATTVRLSVHSASRIRNRPPNANSNNCRCSQMARIANTRLPCLGHPGCRRYCPTYPVWHSVD